MDDLLKILMDAVATGRLFILPVYLINVSFASTLFAYICNLTSALALVHTCILHLIQMPDLKMQIRNQNALSTFLSSSSSSSFLLLLFDVCF